MKFFRKHQKKIIAALALLMAALMILPMITTILSGAGAVTQADINALKKSAETLAQQKKNLSRELDALEGEIDSAMSKKLVVEQEINVVEEQIANTESMIALYDDQIAQEEENLTAAQAEEAQHYNEACQRVRAMEEQGTATYWEVLFGAATFGDLLDRAMMINDTVEYDNALMEALEQARIAVEQAKAELENSRAEQVSAKEALQAQKTELDAKKATINALLAELQAKQDTYEGRMADLNAAAASMDKEIAAKQKELERQLAQSKVQINYGSGYIWPLDGCYTITSFFGPRKHPITGVAGNHGGTDVRASYGTPIKAARGGTVMTSTYNSSYGNYVVVLHDNGESTLYAHMSKRAVSEGATVTQGQTVGYVGSTGSSTGNHLHYEIRVNGTRVDALNYYKGMTFWTTSGAAFNP